MKLLSDDALEQSTVAANCRMNRERRLTGSNGYARELGFNPLDFLTDRLAHRQGASWLDLCCGTGRALVEAAERLGAAGLAAGRRCWRIRPLPLGVFEDGPEGLQVAVDVAEDGDHGFSPVVAR